jgi:hypothetical protein
MGRSSVEATKASLMRAVRAVLAALLLRVAGFLWRVLAVCAPDFLVEVDRAAVVGFFDAEDLVAEPAADDFFVDLGLVEVGAAGFDVESPEDCAATGATTINRDNNPASKRSLVRKTVFGEAKTLMSPLYAAFGRTERLGTTGVTAKSQVPDKNGHVNGWLKTHLALRSAVRYTE